ncbi:hypothetical protein ACWDOP_33530 [Nocardia sp. NPDC003693]
MSDSLFETGHGRPRSASGASAELEWLRRCLPWVGFGVLLVAVLSAVGGVVTGVIVGRRLEALDIAALAWPECSIFTQLLVVPLAVGVAAAGLAAGVLTRVAVSVPRATALGWGAVAAVVLFGVFWVVAREIATAAAEWSSLAMTETPREALAHYLVRLAAPDLTMRSLLSALLSAVVTTALVAVVTRRGRQRGVRGTTGIAAASIIVCAAVFGAAFSVHALDVKDFWLTEYTGPPEVRMPN